MARGETTSTSWTCSTRSPWSADYQSSPGSRKYSSGLSPCSGRPCRCHSGSHVYKRCWNTACCFWHRVQMRSCHAPLIEVITIVQAIAPFVGIVVGLDSPEPSVTQDPADHSHCSPLVVLLYPTLREGRPPMGKYDHIDFTPLKNVADEAAKGLKYRRKANPSDRGGLTPEEAGKQGIGSGVQRAVNLKNRDEVSPETAGSSTSWVAPSTTSPPTGPGSYSSTSPLPRQPDWVPGCSVPWPGAATSPPVSPHFIKSPEEKLHAKK